MPDQSGRPKVGPADPETQRKALADYEKSASKEARDKKANPLETDKKAAVSAPVKRSILQEIRDAIDEHIPREATHGGKTVMDAVDQAVEGAKDKKSDYF